LNEAYDLIVIGAGAAGLTAAGFGGRINAKVALIEKNKLGGDCTWVGCVPSKALLKIAKVAHTIRTADKYGITSSPPEIDMAKVRDYVQNTVQEIYQHETPEVFSEEYNVDVVLGKAEFIDSYTVKVGERTLTAKKIILATGAKPLVPPIDGIEDVPYHTNLTIFEKDYLPDHLLIIGGGPIGMEMAQAHARLGARVTVMDSAIMRRDDPEVAQVLQSILEREGVNFELGMVKSAHMDGDIIVLKLDNGTLVSGDMLLVAAGRIPNVHGLGLDAAGVAYTDQGIQVDKFLRTSAEHIYAVGDCTPGPKFTHYSGWQASVAARNALFPIVNSNGHDENLPWVTFTEPEAAHVGLTEVQARQKFGDAVKVYYFPLTLGDRSMTEDDREGFIKIIYKGSGTLLGATVVANRAGEMIVEFGYALRRGFGFSDIVGMMHAYPTYSDVVRKAVSYVMIEELFEGASGRVINTVSKVLF